MLYSFNKNNENKMLPGTSFIIKLLTFQPFLIIISVRTIRELAVLLEDKFSHTKTKASQLQASLSVLHCTLLLLFS